MALGLGIGFGFGRSPRHTVGPPTANNWQIGDSITLNPYLFPSSTSGYAALFDAAKGITSHNLAFASQGIYAGFDGYSQAIASGVDPYSLTLMMGLNDARLTALQATSTNIIIGGAADIFSRHYASLLRPFSGGTQVGTWIDYNGPAPKLNPTIQASQTPGDTITMAFNGDAVSIGTLLQLIPSGDSFGNRGFTIHIDGVLKYTFDPSVLNCNGSTSVALRGAAPNQYGWTPYAIILSELGSGAHTCLVTVTAGNGTYFAWLDGIVELYPHTSVALTKPCVWMDVPTLNATGSSGSFTDAAKIAQTNIDVWESSQFTWFRGYSNFGRVKTNNYYDPNDAAQVYSDNVHPSGFGTSASGSYKISQPLIALMTI